MSEPAFTAQDVLDRVRLIKCDATYSATSACLWVTDAVLELWTQAPKTRKDTQDNVREYSKITSISQAVPCSIAYMPILTDYVIARAFMEDSDSMEHRARAAEHFKLFFDRAHLVEYGLPFRQTPAPMVGVPK